ncbi:Mth938-like domain-containing protein [Alkalisalibacterium limincola]|uniref:Xcc1710-like domain-containing protein n=1 Tax=Alkalisalibacterium limincola TaxID=2699169 RepID=A0A5C8L132_9GAMM|nr:Mth938-like domain-containing protein [Alkalisalibacterium limincola]TXK65955.1 hypothetical protein FU658_02515 [Alkalisalibacterium limincola]
MQLQQDSNPAGYVVRRVEAGTIEVNDRSLASSFIVYPSGLIEDWPPLDCPSLEPGHLEQALSLAPEVVLLGSGPVQRFPSQAVMAACLTRGVGIEVMDNAAAARTYNVLAAEGRSVVAAFLLPG